MTNPNVKNATTQLGFGAHVYERDVEHLKPENTTLQKAQRVAVMALPFLALYKPFGSAISIGMNTTRSISCLFQTKEAFSTKGATKKQTIALFQTAIAATSVAGAIFGNVYGMAITSGHDVLVSLYEMCQHLENARKGEKAEYEKAAEKFLQAVTNSLYLIVIVHGSLEIIVLSFAAQILLEAYKSQSSFRKFKDSKDVLDLLEGFAHLGMAGIRGYQMAPMVEMLVFKAELKKAMEEHANKPKQEPTKKPRQIAPGKQGQSITANNSKGSTAETVVGVVSATVAATAVAASGLAEEKPVTLVDKDEDPLAQAVWRCDLSAVKDLVANGADVNMRYYCYNDSKNNPDFDYRMDTEPLIFLALDRPDILQFLINSGADINAIHFSGWGEYNILHKAVESISTNDHVEYGVEIPIESLHVILNAGCPVNSVIKSFNNGICSGDNFQGYTALSLAAEYGGSENCISILLEHGADRTGIKLPNSYDSTAVPCSALKEEGLNLDSLNKALIDALFEEDFNVVKELVKAGADVNAYDDLEITDTITLSIPIIFWVVNDPQTLQFLIDSGADVNATYRLWNPVNGEMIDSPLNSRTILHFATDEDNMETPAESIYIIMKAGFNQINAQTDGWDKKNLTALHMAAMAGNEELMIALLKSGADINILDDEGYAPWQIALMGIGSEWANEFETSNLLSAEVLELFIEKGVNLNAYKNGWCLLSSLSVKDDEEGLILDAITAEFLAKLIKQGQLNVNSRDPETGMTPFLRAVEHGNFEIIKWLFDNGADIAAKDSSGRSALEIARRLNWPNQINWLRENGAR